MTDIFYQDDTGFLINADSLDGLKMLDDNSVDFCITSPPYWAIRDYGTAQWSGGDLSCDHVKNPAATNVFGNPKFNKGRPSREAIKTPGYYYDDICGKCGAIKEDYQLGQEPNVKDYITRLSDIFDGVSRVLKPDGTLWVVINDTWFSSTKGTGGKKSFQPGSKGSFFKSGKYESSVLPKSLVNVPHRLAIEMTDSHDWIHRSTVCWHKNNVMPSSVKDRFTRDFEYVLIFSKNKDYYFKQLLEPYTAPMNRWGGDKLKADGKSEWDGGTGQETYRERDMRPNKEGRNMRSVWDLQEDFDFGSEDNAIWNINNRSVKGLGHYAVYPEELVRKAIEFGCPEGGVVLDPFMGSGTTGRVARSMGRKWVGVELNKDYCSNSVKRILGG